MSDSSYISLLSIPPLPSSGKQNWGRLYGSAQSLAIANSIKQATGPVLLVTADAPAAMRLEQELQFYLGDDIPLLNFPDWETLPYDMFSPHQDIISERLSTLSRLPGLSKGALIVPITTLMLRVVPRQYLDGHSLVMDVGDSLDIDGLRRQLESRGYICVSPVSEHG
ncbi:MAG: transcription-repair coupling factor, partial [Gammaproteobacteria bacterium]|nr:transcription-repair coupling factor [Gammaproteobacteria bacterium]